MISGTIWCSAKYLLLIKPYSMNGIIIEIKFLLRLDVFYIKVVSFTCKHMFAFFFVNHNCMVIIWISNSNFLCVVSVKYSYWLLIVFFFKSLSSWKVWIFHAAPHAFHAAMHIHEVWNEENMLININHDFN